MPAMRWTLVVVVLCACGDPTLEPPVLVAVPPGNTDRVRIDVTGLDAGTFQFKLGARTLFATHFHELIQLAEMLPGIRNYNVAVSEADGKVVFLHKIVPGGADRSYGIHVAQLAGLPGPVVQRASSILEELEKTSGRAV